jgi:hypothetical protein
LSTGGRSLVTPREEDPQIVVPLADIYVQRPGAIPEEVEKLVATPLERLLWQIDGVEYVYSMSRRDMAIVTVRFFVGEDRENSLVKLHNKISHEHGPGPAIVRGWVIKPVEIDDVPIVNLTLYSTAYDDHALRRIGEEVLARFPRWRISPGPKSWAAGSGRSGWNCCPKSAWRGSAFPCWRSAALKGADASVTAGTFHQANQLLHRHQQRLSLLSFRGGRSGGGGSRRAAGLSAGCRPIIDGPEEATAIPASAFPTLRGRRESAHLSGRDPGPGQEKGHQRRHRGRRILAKHGALEKEVIPTDVRWTSPATTGKTAQEKVNDLLGSLAFAMSPWWCCWPSPWDGGRPWWWPWPCPSAFPWPFSSISPARLHHQPGHPFRPDSFPGPGGGRPHHQCGQHPAPHRSSGRHKTFLATLFAVREVLPPVIMSTLAIIVSFTPLFFITGMMGPYMAPMAANVPVTVIFSTLCALTIVPWMSHLLLRKTIPGKNRTRNDRKPAQWITRIYRRGVDPFLDSRTKRWLLLVCR